MASELNVNKTQIILNSVVFSNPLPDFWNPGTDKFTYGVLNELFKFVEENNLSSAVIKPAISVLCGRDKSSKIKNTFNLQNSIKNFVKKSHDHHNKVYMKLYNNDILVPVVGDYCSGLGIDLNTIHLCLQEKKHKNFELNNGAVLELEDVKHKEKLTWQAFSELLFRLSSADYQINSDSARYYVGALN